MIHASTCYLPRTSNMDFIEPDMNRPNKKSWLAKRVRVSPQPGGSVAGLHVFDKQEMRHNM